MVLLSLVLINIYQQSKAPKSHLELFCVIFVVVLFSHFV